MVAEPTEIAPTITVQPVRTSRDFQRSFIKSTFNSKKSANRCHNCRNAWLG
jgi:hypothetical protein